MPDIQQQLDSLTRALPSVTEEFQGVARSLDNITGNAESTANAFQNLVLTTEGQLNAAKDLEKELPKLAKEMSQLTKGSRITTKGFKALEDSLGEAGKDLSKSLQAIYGQTDKAIGKVNNAFEKFSSRIPVIGKTIQKGFENFMGSFEGLMDKVYGRIQRAGAGGRGAMAGAGILGAAGVAAATLLGRQFNQIEKSSISISKATGLTGKDLEGVRTSMIEAQNASYQLGISMEESAAASSALVTSLGNFRKITPELIKQTTVLAKFTGASAEEAGKFVGTLTKGFGKSAEDVDKFVDGIATFATREGVNARKVLGDIVSDTNLMSIYMSRGEDALKRAAVQAAKMGMSLSETQGVSEAFLDLEGGAELVGQINMYTNGSLNALEMFNLAAKNDTVGIMNRLNQAFSTPQGIRFIEDMPGLAKQFAGQFGMNLKQLRVAAGLDRERSKILTADQKKQQDIEKSVAEQQTKFQKIANEIQKNIFPVVNTIAEKLVKFTEGITASQVKGALKIGAALAGGAIVALLSKGTRLNPMFVQNVGVGGGIGDQISKGKGRGITKATKPISAAARLAQRTATASKGTGFFGRTAGLAKGAGILGKGLGRAALRAVPGLGLLYGIYEAYNFASEGKYLAAALALGAGAAGVIPGIGQGASLAISGALGVGSAIAGAAKGAVVSSPRLFMVGEENRSEVIVPTERIRKGLPINAGVARELGSIGVPGFYAGGAMAGAFAARSRAKEQQIQRSQSTVQQGAQSDPAVIRERELAFQRQAQAARDEQRRMMQQIERKTLEVLEEEKKAASNISTSHGKFGRGVALFQRIQKAAGEYARKTTKRFADNLRKNNGDLSAALKDTWSQTVGDIEKLQARLIGKLENFIGKLADKAVNFGLDLIDKGINKTMDFLKIGNRANRQQFEQTVRDEFRVSGADTVVDPRLTAATGGSSTIGQRASFGFAEGRDGFALNKDAGFIERGAYKVGQTFAKIETFLGPYAEKFKQIGGQIDAASVSMVASGNLAGAATHLVKKQLVESALTGTAGLGGVSLTGPQSSLLAGTGALAQGDYKGAAKAVGMDLGRKGITAGVNKALGMGAAKSGMLKGLSAGGGIAAAGLGAVDGLMKGDYKAAAKGAAEGAVGYVLGGALAAAGLGPLGPVVGSIVAGPVTAGIITTGKELGKGAKNLGKGAAKIFEGDFKGGGKALLKGGGQLLTAGFKGGIEAIKGIGAIFGIGKTKPKEYRRKFLSRLMKDLSSGKPLVGEGGRLRGDKKSQEFLLGALKWGENGPDQKRFDEMTAQIMTIAGVPMDIAQAFIYAAAGADMDKDTLAKIDAEMGAGFKNADLSHQFDMSTKKGRGRALRFMELGDAADAARATVADTNESNAASERVRQAAIVRQEIARLAADGLTLEEVRQVSAMAGGRGLAGDYGTGGSRTGMEASTGNVYLDGVIVGTLTQESADELKADGLPAGTPRNNMSAQDEDRLYGTSHL